MTSVKSNILSTKKKPLYQQLHQAKKLVLILAIFVSVTDNSDKKVTVEKISCISYLIQFQENQEKVKVLLNSNSNVNAINPAFAQKLGSHIQNNNVGSQKIDASIFETFGIVIADFYLKNKGGKPRIF